MHHKDQQSYENCGIMSVADELGLKAKPDRVVHATLPLTCSKRWAEFLSNSLITSTALLKKLNYINKVMYQFPDGFQSLIQTLKALR